MKGFLMFQGKVTVGNQVAVLMALIPRRIGNFREKMAEPSLLVIAVVEVDRTEVKPQGSHIEQSIDFTADRFSGQFCHSLFYCRCKRLCCATVIVVTVKTAEGPGGILFFYCRRKPAAKPGQYLLACSTLTRKGMGKSLRSVRGVATKPGEIRPRYQADEKPVFDLYSRWPQ